MPIPAELLNRKFEKSGFSGYKAADVDQFMAELSQAVSKENREAADLRRRLEETERKLSSYRDMEESLKNAMLSAQRLADQTAKDSKTRAELILRDAEIKAEKIVEKAEGEIIFRKEEAERIKREVSNFRRHMMQMYRQHLELITQLPCEDPEAPAASPEDVAPEQPGSSGQEPAQPENSGAVGDDAAQNAAEEPEAQPAAPAAPAEEAPKEPEPSADAFAQAAAASAPEESADTAAPETELPGETASEPEAAKPETPASDAPAQGTPVIRLNLRYNEKTGEYESVDRGGAAPISGADDGLRFGSRYDIRSGRFRDEEKGKDRR